MELKIEEEFINRGFKYVCGIDEVGRGPLAGPIVICCYILDVEKLKKFKDDNIKLFEIINDSKKLSDKKRRELVDFIKLIAVDFSFGESSNMEIDKYGIIEANRLAIERGVNNLKIKPDYYLFDYNTCLVDFLNTPYDKIIKGDSKVFSIACSSILAKVYRDNIMNDFSKIYNKYGFENHAGYGTKKHIDAIKEFGLSDLHRKSFCKNFI